MLGKHEIPVGYRCVPTAIMLLTGKQYSEVRKTINDVRGFKETQGVCRVATEHGLSTLLRLGLKIVERHLGNGKQLKSYNFKGFWIVETSRHWLAVVDNEVADSFNVWWTPIEVSRSSRLRVKRAWRLED